MKKNCLIALGLVWLTCGCMHSQVTLLNGQTLRVRGKPKLKDGYFLVHTGPGRTEKIPAGRVVEIRGW
jgi:hypothetical protein